LSYSRLVTVFCSGFTLISKRKINRWPCWYRRFNLLWQRFAWWCIRHDRQNLFIIDWKNLFQKNF